MRALLNQLKVKDLRTLAKGVSKDLSIVGYSKMSKPKLVDELHKLAMRVPDVKAQFSSRLSQIPSIQEYGDKPPPRKKPTKAPVYVHPKEEPKPKAKAKAKAKPLFNKSKNSKFAKQQLPN